MTAASAPAFAAKRQTLAPAATGFQPTGVFQSLEFETNAVAGLGSWRGVLKRIGNERAGYAACDAGAASCPSYLRNWRQKLVAWRGLSPKAKLIAVNRFANATIRYTDDRKLYGAPDMWASPAQSLRGRGDCEDYALLKYASLRELGFPESALRLVVLNDLRKGIGHAVLSVRIEGQTFILDNQDARVLRHDAIAYYAPIYSVNATGRWINIATRSLKPRKAEPVMLVASAEELDAIAPAAQGEPKTPVLLPRLRPTLVDEPMRPMPSGATAIAARLDIFKLTPVAMLLRPTVEG